MNHRLKKRFILACMVLIGFVGTTAQAATQILTLNESERLQADISAKATNRIQVANDRIVNIFGDEGTFVAQNDEHSGQVFMKTTAENGDKPLALTLVTENGLTQDLNLIPTAIEASTLILKVNPKPMSGQSPVASLLAPFSRNQNPIDRQIQVMKQAVSKELPTQKESSVPARKQAGFSFAYQKTYVADDLKVQHWIVQNTRKNSEALLEKNVYARGDLALSLQKTLLSPSEKTDLYILRN